MKIVDINQAGGSQALLWFTDQGSVSDEWQSGLTDFKVTEAREIPQSGLQEWLSSYDCVLISGKISGLNPMEALEILQTADSSVPVVFCDLTLTATDTVRLIRGGAYQCVGYGDSPETLRDVLANAVEEKRMRTRTRRAASKETEAWRASMIGQSQAMEDVAETIRLVGSKRCTVLIGGESGTGKEIAARAIHMASPRATQPFVAVNCTALPENLLEAELFGHVKGAFTGAANLRIGRFEQANRGTLFLDEIGDMPMELQAKLLRVLQEREVQRLGSAETIKVDVRIIAASNANLLERVREGRFREDLYYRLNVVPLEMPPLRRRSEDIPMLVEHFVRKICRFEDIPVKPVSPEAMARLQASPWPGNVRQLENTVEMAIAMSGDRDVLQSSDFGLSNPVRAKVVAFEPHAVPETLDCENFETAVSQFERKLLDRALLRTAGNKTAAAALLGLKRTTLIMKLQNFEGPKPLQACG